MINKKELIKEWNKIKPKETPLVFTNITGKKIVIKDESVNLSSTYKDKHGWAMGLDYLKNHFPNPFIYYLGSTGNAGFSDFLYAEKLNKLLGEKKVLVVNFYPGHYDDKILGPDSFSRFTDGKRFREEMERFKSGKLIQVDFRKKYWFDDFKRGYTPCLDKMNEFEMGKEIGINKISRENSKDITEGFKPTYFQVMEEIISQIKGKLGRIPKTLAIIQFGAGMLYDDSKEVVKKNDVPIDIIAVSTGNKDTIADKICDSSETWQESLKDLLKKGVTRAKNSGDKIFQVNESEILDSLKILRKLNIEAEPSGGVGLAMAISSKLNNLIKNFQNYELIVVINTGNGLKKSSLN